MKLVKSIRESGSTDHLIIASFRHKELTESSEAEHCFKVAGSLLALIETLAVYLQLAGFRFKAKQNRR